MLSVADRPEALEAARESLRTWNEIGNLGRMAVFKFLASLELKRGHPARAVRLAAAARQIEQVGGELSETLQRAGNPLEEARPLLEPEVYDRVGDRDR